MEYTEQDLDDHRHTDRFIAWLRASFEMLICASAVWSLCILKETNMPELINIAGVALEERAGSERA